MKKPIIPDFPESFKKLKELNNRNFKILLRSEQTVIPGVRMYETRMVLQCPFCSMKFKVISKYSHIGDATMEPSNCPNCNFPYNVLLALIKRCNKKKTEP